MVTAEIAYRLATSNRLLAAELFEGLTPDQWRTRSLCEGWTVREVAGHLVEPLESEVGPLGLVWALVRYRGSLERMVDASAHRAARRPTSDLVQALRDGASVQLDPPIIGPGGPMSDSFIHLRDAARPLGSDVSPPPDDWRHVLDFLVDPGSTTRGFVPKGALAGLRLVATDTEWQHGEGAELSGPAEALTMAVTGRSVALADLAGPGVAVLGALLPPTGPL